MKEYIDKTELLKIVGEMPLSWEYGEAVSDIYDIIKEQPAADVVERKDLARVQVAYDKVGQALDAADRIYTQGYTDAMADHNLVERKRGEWKYIGGDEWCCSVCGFVASTEGRWEPMTANFCEECGADMRGEKDAAD